MKHFINVFFLAVWLPWGKTCFFMGRWGVRVLAAALCSGLADDTQCVQKGSFQMLIACPFPRETGSAAVCSAKEPQGVPPEKIPADRLHVVCAS